MAQLINLLDEVLQNRDRARKNYVPRRLVDGKIYRKLFRFTEEHVEFLTQNFLPENEETRGGALTNIQKMQTFLRYISDPGFQVVFKKAHSEKTKLFY